MFPSIYERTTYQQMFAYLPTENLTLERFSSQQVMVSGYSIIFPMFFSGKFDRNCYSIEGPRSLISKEPVLDLKKGVLSTFIRQERCHGPLNLPNYRPSIEPVKFCRKVKKDMFYVKVRFYHCQLSKLGWKDVFEQLIIL